MSSELIRLCCRNTMRKILQNNWIFLINKKYSKTIRHMNELYYRIINFTYSDTVPFIICELNKNFNYLFKLVIHYN